MRTLLCTVSAILLILWAASLPAGDFQKGWDAYSSTDYTTALAEWQALAEAGDPEACYGMGLLYGNGFGVDMNDEQALKFYGIAAEKGHAEAQYSLGIMHQNGWGVPIDEELGMQWYLQAADQGVVGAQLALGRVYALDFSEKYDPVKAYMWFSLAARQGISKAKTAQFEYAAQLTSAQIAEAQKLIREWLAKHPRN